MDGHKCINGNVVMYSDQEQESVRDGGDGVGRRRSFGYNASSRVVEHLQFIVGGDQAVDQRRGSREKQSLSDTMQIQCMQFMSKPLQKINST